AKNREERRRHGAKGLSEPESRALAELLDRHQPARIVSIHQPVACVDWDGPARAVAAAMADACPLPLRRLGSMPGSLGSYAGVDLGIPIVTFELRRGDQRPSFGAGGRSNTLFLCLSPCRPIRWLCVRWGGTL
ncbi:MAG: protein MpaA, partial [Planctomycetota bacterium]